MPGKGLFIWVEGPDDVLFFERVIRPILDPRYDWVRIIPYANQTEIWVNEFLKSIKGMKAECIFVADLDSASCITRRVEPLQSVYKQCNREFMQIVVQEIESWYLAGLEDKVCHRLKISLIKNTNGTTKEQFNRLIPKGFKSRVDFMVEVLKHFSVETAVSKNDSFQYFVKKYNLLS